MQRCIYSTNISPLFFRVAFTGQRLFRRSARGSRSLSESSSVGLPEEGTTEGSPSHDSSTGGDVHPDASLTGSEVEPQPVGGATEETDQEGAAQDGTQVEVNEASQLEQPENQGAEPGLR